MTPFTTFSHPLHDMGAPTGYRLPPRLLRPVIAALVCRFKRHDFNSIGSADGSWHDDGRFNACARCAMRSFPLVSSKDRFDEILRDERVRIKTTLDEAKSGATSGA